MNISVYFNLMHSDNKIVSFVVITASYLRFSYAFHPMRESATFFARHNASCESTRSMCDDARCDFLAKRIQKKISHIDCVKFANSSSSFDTQVFSFVIFKSGAKIAEFYGPQTKILDG